LAINFAAITVPWLDKTDVWTIAERERAKCWDGNIPVDADLIAEKVYGIVFIPINSLKQNVHSEAFLAGSLDEIDYDPTSPEVRIKFSVAHELGHFVLHPTQIRALRPASFLEWKDVIDNIPEGMWGRAEWQAREFAGRLLVPRDHLLTEIEKHRETIERAKEQIQHISSDDLIEVIARKICKKFGVSNDVIEYRITNEGIDLLNP
jgi:Zn-dependent peptidase ImmA (M78 family)